MLILIGSDGNNNRSRVSKRFGHSKYFIVYDTNNNSYEVYENTELGNHKHENLKLFIDKGIEAVIVGNIGPHAFDFLKSFNQKIYLARNTTIEDAIQKFINNELKELSEPTVKKSIGHNH